MGAVKRQQGTAKYRTAGYGRGPQPLANVGDVSIRRSVNVSMTPSAKAIIEKMAERLGMSETQITSRLLEWYAVQDDAVKLGILGLWPQGYEGDLVRAVVKKLGPAKKRKG